MKSPIDEFTENAAGMVATELAGYCNMSNTRFQLLADGAYDRIPILLKNYADEVSGAGAGEKLEADYQAFRKSLDFDTRLENENKLYPAGRAYGMCP